MYKKLLDLVTKGLTKQVSATGLGVFRIFFGLVLLHEVGFLFYFRQLIFDPVPFLDQVSPLLSFLLLLWGIAAFHLTIGRYTRVAALVSYLFWLLFLIFTPMWQDFNGGFDQLMTGGSLLLIFLSSETALSIDNLRMKLNYSDSKNCYAPPTKVSVLSYYIPLGFCLGLVYFDSVFHKLSAEFWRNGLGSWLPSTMPYYISAIDMSWLLNIKPLQLAIGYALMVFQFVFVFVCYFRPFRIPLMLMGVVFHAGITLTLNIYPFGVGILAFYLLLVPFSWWRWLKHTLSLDRPVLTVLYDRECPLCNRTVITVEHFDIFNAIEFNSLQTYARQYRELDALSDDQLLKDLYAIDSRGRLYWGVDTYIQILLKMKYTFLLGLIMNIPGIHHVCNHYYRRIADGRSRLVCDATCPTSLNDKNVTVDPLENIYRRYVSTVQQRAQRITKCLMVIFFLQLNSTIHYGIIYRLGIDRKATEISRFLTELSDSMLLFSHAFLGITPHGLYLHDHFEGFNHLFAFTYRDQLGQEKWLPFVNEEGRIIAPNWGRIQSMWANAAIMADLEQVRFYKFTEKVTAFWGTKVGLDLSDAEMTIKMKEVQTPMEWEHDLRNRNISEPWLDIGKVIWKDGSMQLEIPDIDIEVL